LRLLTGETAMSINGPTAYSAPAVIQMPIIGTGANTVAVQATGNATITGTFDVSLDGENWQAIAGTPVGGGDPTSSFTGDGYWTFPVSAQRLFRIDITEITGTETITVVAGP
jgi:hypothetical protein